MPIISSDVLCCRNWQVGYLYHLVNKCFFGLECMSVNAFVNSHLHVCTKEAWWQNTLLPINLHVTLSTEFSPGGWMGDEVLTLLKANMRIQNKTRKEALLSTTSSMANPLRIPPSTTQCFLSRVQLGRKPSVRTLAGSQGYVTMQLTVVLIRKSLAVGAQNICFSKGVGR